MSGSTSSLLTAPTVTGAAASTAAAAAAAGVAPAAAPGSAAAPNALTSLSSNFTSFLNLLLTQLKNQDPTTPMDTNSFTTELVQFSSVEQQITTNSSLTSLIQATQGTEVIQATGVVGKSVTVDSTQVPLQNGSATVNYATTAAEPVDITVTDASGVKVAEVTGTSNAGANTWTWDGKNSAGVQQPDGAYTVSINGTQSGGTAAAVPFTATGTATGVTNSNGAVTLQVGAVSVPFSSVESVAGS